LNLGLVDELCISQVPVLFGTGIRYFGEFVGDHVAAAWAVRPEKVVMGALGGLIKRWTTANRYPVLAEPGGQWLTCGSGDRPFGVAPERPIRASRSRDC
jgi:hypothetical protein